MITPPWRYPLIASPASDRAVRMCKRMQMTLGPKIAPMYGRWAGIGGMKFGFGVRNIIWARTRSRSRKSELLVCGVSEGGFFTERGGRTPYNKLYKALRI